MGERGREGGRGRDELRVPRSFNTLDLARREERSEFIVERRRRLTRRLHARTFFPLPLFPGKKTPEKEKEREKERERRATKILTFNFGA